MARVSRGGERPQCLNKKKSLDFWLPQNHWPLERKAREPEEVGGRPQAEALSWLTSPVMKLINDQQLQFLRKQPALAEAGHQRSSRALKDMGN